VQHVEGKRVEPFIEGFKIRGILRRWDLLMVKCYYMSGNQPEKGYNEDMSLLIMTGFKRSELVIRDLNREITSAEYNAYKMVTYLPESDNHSLKYIIKDKELVRKFLSEKKCKMLCSDKSINETNVIENILENFFE
jgi:hypothetical protein